MHLQRGNDLGGSCRVRLELQPMVCGPWCAVIELWSEDRRESVGEDRRIMQIGNGSVCTVSPVCYRVRRSY